MTEERVSYGNTGNSSTSLPLKGMEECVVSAAGWQPMFTTYSGAAGITKIGENTTAAWNVFVENVTHTDINGR